MNSARAVLSVDWCPDGRARATVVGVGHSVVVTTPALKSAIKAQTNENGVLLDFAPLKWGRIVLDLAKKGPISVGVPLGCESLPQGGRMCRVMIQGKGGRPERK